MVDIIDHPGHPAELISLLWMIKNGSGSVRMEQIIINEH